MTTLLIATRNAHKVAEIRAILGGQFQFLTLNDFPNAPKVIEDADTFAGNATKKAVELAQLDLQPIQQFNSSTVQRFSFSPMIPAWKWTRSAENPASIPRVLRRWTKMKIHKTRTTMPNCCAC